MTYIQKISKFRDSESRVGLSGYAQVTQGSTPCIGCLASDDGLYIGRNM